ncbi:intra-flagellar transport protein 57 [Polychytrium aggregatum]|uniref:intra-flagellar transport protein 57 n=1 Tax=Polychytrium aggregatum TaxID=110093 RepID=UPI0022FF1CAD|nr:intra-flagellar transport protein 57 [Polychytrium aggregatum]KAI9207305.1 intra-flagellar transport protein 57 [Polychytrium aggregatum]
MDEILDKLRVLNYQKDFCRSMGFRPLSRVYFVVSASNPNEQFYYLTSLFSWLMKLNHQPFDPPGQFDDPNASAANMVDALKQMGIQFEYGPNRLKQGYGEAVLYTLQNLVDRALQANGFVFQKPAHRNDDYPEEAEVDMDAEVTTELVEDRLEVEEEDEEVFVDSYTPGPKADESKQTPQAAATKPKIDPAEWRIEVERVSPFLKVQITNDNKDWRIHLEQMQHHKVTIHSSLSETKTHLTKLHAEIEKTLEKIVSREKYINTQFEGQTEEFRSLQDQLSELKQKYNITNTNVTELTNELSKLSEMLDGVKARMDDIGNGMTDSRPLVNIKQGVSKLKAEIKQMDLRIGVIEHTLLHAKLSAKSGLVSDRPNYGLIQVR